MMISMLNNNNVDESVTFQYVDPEDIYYGYTYEDDISPRVSFYKKINPYVIEFPIIWEDPRF